MNDSVTQLSRLIWSVTDFLHGDFKRSEFGKVVLPFTVLRRLDCLLDPTRPNVLETAEKFAHNSTRVLDAVLKKSSDYPFYNTSRATLAERRR